MTNYSNFFSYTPFWLQKYITAYLKTNLILGSVGNFEIQTFEWTAYFQY